MSDYYTPPTESMDDLLQVLADKHRRVVLSFLRESPTRTVSREELADALSARMDPDSTELETQLHHCHLPQLADAAIVDYDPTTGTVEYSGHPELESLHDALDGAGKP